MTPFQRARLAAKQLREQLFTTAAGSGLRSKALVDGAAAEDAEDFVVELVNPKDMLLGGADAVLLRNLRQVLVRNDVGSAERAFLVAHELGHWKLHPEDPDSCHRVIDSSLNPADGDSFGAQKVEAYGARERAELQANTFAREFLLPREVARALFLAGKTAKELQAELDLPLELVRQQLLDGLLLPEPHLPSEQSDEPIVPTPEQVSAATSTERTSLVVAGPGTGKTTTLLMRVQHLISQGVKPSEMLVLTFSNRAARELVDRLHVKGVQDAAEIWVGTFHAFGLEFLRKNHEAFGLRSRFGVADKMAQISLLEPHIYGLGLSAFNPLGDPLGWLDEAVKAIQRAKDELAGPDEFSAAVETSVGEASSDALERQRDIAKLYRCYESKKQADDSLVDMGDLVMLPAVALTQDYPSYVASVGRFRHVLVDEYQDVNRASAQLVKALGARAESLWVVGDARQAIYRFRGASMRSIVQFGADYPVHKRFPLNENRRSFEEVVRVFEHTGREANPLQLMLPLEDVRPVRGQSGVRPRHIQCANDEIVHGELVAEAKRLHSAGVGYRNQVVLASTHDTCSSAAVALNSAGVPALHLGDIFQRGEVKDLLSLLQLFVDRSGSGLLRVAQLPGMAVSQKDLDVLLQWLKSTRPDALSWFDELPPGLSEEGLTAVRRWGEVFEGLTATMSPWDVTCQLLLDRSDILKPHLRGDSILDVTRRLALWQFIYYLRVPEGGSAYQTVGSFITRLRRRLRVGDDRELRIPPPEADSLDAVAVMTIHGSKGLEFEAVHLVDVDARHFSAFGDSDLVPSALLKGIAAEGNFEEETEASNKLYVALSRAKKHLVLYERQLGSKAKCAAGISQAAHLFDKVAGVAVLKRPSGRAPLTPTSTVGAPFELSAFLTYRACPRRFYYDFVKGLSPSAGLHPAALVEGAVMRELFAPYGEVPGSSPGEVERVLDGLAVPMRDAIPHLRAYADHLLDSGRRWIGASRLPMAKPVDYVCGGLPLRISPHRTTKTNSTVTLEFVRAKPAGKLARQHSVLRWLLKHLSASFPSRSFSGRVFVLSTGEEQSVSPDSRSYNNAFVVNSATSMLSGDFEAKPNQWECPKCRHFTYCPA